jgi:hypothetical protein
METKVIKKKVIFKPYDQKQYVCLPIDISSFIGEGNIVRIIDGVVEAMDMSVLENYYSGGGCSSYHRKMLIKVWIYVYCTKVYTSRPLSKALVKHIPLCSWQGHQAQGMTNAQPMHKTNNLAIMRYVKSKLGRLPLRFF